ncbi:MAG: lysostaphin resistance A-like protein [Pirellulaceae bacterium]
MHPLASLFVLLFSAWVLLVLFGFFFGWGRILWKWRSGSLDWNKLSEAEFAPWGMIDLMTAMGLLVFSLTLASRTLPKPIPTQVPAPVPELSGASGAAMIALPIKIESIPTPSPSGNFAGYQEAAATEAPGTPMVPEKVESKKEPVKALPSLETSAWVASAQLLATLLTTLWIMRRLRVPASVLGWSTRHLATDFRMAVQAFILFGPLVYASLALLNYLYTTQYSHPLLEMVDQKFSGLLLAAWMAVIIAPITEEFAFRVLLQGYLESIAAGPFSWKQFWYGRGSYHHPGDPVITAEQAFSVLPIAAVGPSEDDGTGDRMASPGAQIDSVRLTRQPWWPILVSGTLFGLMHYSYGLSWAPLILLGVVLGVLYRATHRIWPSLFFHVIFNSMAICSMALQILQEQLPKP